MCSTNLFHIHCILVYVKDDWLINFKMSRVNRGFHMGENSHFLLELFFLKNERLKYFRTKIIHTFLEVSV